MQVMQPTGATFRGLWLQRDPGGDDFLVVAGFLGVWVGWICVGCWGRVLLFESPPLMRKDSDRPPSKWPENGALLSVPE